VKIYDSGLRDVQQVKDVIDKDLERFIATWRQEYDQGSIEAIDAYCQIVLRGGKRLRGILAMQSYYAHGGTDDAVALGAARVLELMQAYLLVIDDIADRSDTRRGGPSAHRLIEATSAAMNMRGDLVHYSQTQAVNAAQCGAHKAALELLELPVADLIARRALTSLHKNIEITGMGQMNDIYNEVTNVILDEHAIERVLIKKSAYYTFVNPLELGAYLAGREALDKNLQSYAINVGCTFQITDDLIGTFGVEAKTGKSINDDIREGKMTLIAQHSLANANDSHRTILRSVLGDRSATNDECDQVRAIMQATGAYEFASQRRNWYAQQAHEALMSVRDLDDDFVSFLDQLINFVATRQS
jgi:geranylgeranyl diphosphate synthase type I